MNSVSLNKLSLGLLPDTVTYAQELKNSERSELERVIGGGNNQSIVTGKLNYNDIIQIDFPDTQYFKEQTTKRQIVLHHTVSGRGSVGDINWWKQNPQRIATAIIIEWDGKIYQLFSSRYWAHHLGTRASNNLALNRMSIGIEIDGWGGLIKHNKKWYPARWDGKVNVANTTARPIENVQLYPKGYRGFLAYEKYSDKQIESLGKLLVYWGGVHNIPLQYNEDMWDVSQRALRGDAGVWSHTSYRIDKSDVHPQPELIKLLKSL